MKRREFLTAGLAFAIASDLRAEAEASRLRMAVIGHTGRGDYRHELAYCVKKPS